MMPLHRAHIKQFRAPRRLDVLPGWLHHQSMKRPATHDLRDFQTAMARALRWTGTAQGGAAEIGFDKADVKAAIASMTTQMFYKTMESEKRPGQMQDVYHVPSRAGVLYVKFTDEGIKEFKLLSFKQK